MPSPGCEHAYPIPRVVADLRLRESLLWNQNRHNTAVLTDTRQASKNQSLFVHVGGYTETDPSGVFVTQQLTTAWSNEMGLFGADSVVRHLQQLEYNLSVGAMDKTYLLERLYGTEETESTTTEISRRSVGMHYGRN